MGKESRKLLPKPRNRKRYVKEARFKLDLKQ